nr:unnamed protein product [Callosobruchus chinensis]
MHQVAYESMDEHAVASSVILSDFYVDDLITGCDDLDSLIQLKKDISDILKSGQFILTQWMSNHPALLDGQEQSNFHITDIEDKSVKTLVLLSDASDLMVKYLLN